MLDSVGSGSIVTLGFAKQNHDDSIIYNILISYDISMLYIVCRSEINIQDMRETCRMITLIYYTNAISGYNILISYDISMLYIVCRSEINIQDMRETCRMITLIYYTNAISGYNILTLSCEHRCPCHI